VSRSWLLAALVVGCGATPAAPDAGAGHGASDELRACAALQSTSVGSVAGAVVRLNALPTQSVACFVASLSRPIEVVGTTSQFSAQPAGGAQSPRLFLLTPGLVASVVGEGDGANLLEFGQWVTPTRTLKGEVALPFTAPLAADAPFTGVTLAGGGTGCGLCHRYETPAPEMNGGFISHAFKPANDTEVKLPAVAALHQACVEQREESPRCELLHAVFDLGEAKQGAFGAEVEYFIQ
jgi:hypothetical protein